MSADKIEHSDNPTIGGGEQFFCGYQGKYISGIIWQLTYYLGLFGKVCNQGKCITCFIGITQVFESLGYDLGGGVCV